ncbi:MAG: hypothetical protein WDK96_04000 [Candidatus Paceibacterota bacterium]|jgi:hypothetical protein
MGTGQYKEKFDRGCEHDWKLHMDADSGDRKSNSIFLCSECGTIVTMLERNSLDSLRLQEKFTNDSLSSQKESQKIQEKNIKISMWANIIATATVLVAFVVLLFGEGLFK